MLPDYISKAVPNPSEKRTPWYKSTAPSYAGVFLWVVFYERLAQGAIDGAGVGLCLLALLAAGLLSYALFYLAPAMLGMKTGYPLYVVGSSTFGTTGGYLMPGLLMGLLQIGWFAVNTSVSTQFILLGLGQPTEAGTPLYAAIAVVWGVVMAYIGVKGIQYVARASLYLNLIAFLMVLFVFAKTAGGVPGYTVAIEKAAPLVAFTGIIQTVIGFFATAGAAGADFGMNNRTARDVRLGGLVGITLAILYAGGLPLMSVAGARELQMVKPDAFLFSDVLASIGTLGTAMFFLFAIASIAPACFCAFIAGNSFATMLPRVPRMGSTMTGAAIAIVLAITGVANDLIGVFTIVGASFGPICGAMTADYLVSGRRWAGPRAGINFAGYIAWALGFLVGIVPFLPLDQAVKEALQPAAVWSYVVGFVVYFILAKAGLQPRTVAIEPEPAGRSSAARVR